MNAANQVRVIVLGSPRSGTTWTMRVLASADGACFVREPDNVDTAADAGGGRTRLGFGPYPVVEPGDEAPEYAALWDIALQGRRALTLRRGAGRRLTRSALHLPKLVRDPLVGIAARALRASAPRRDVVVSTVMAHFSIEWVERRFGPRVVVLQRNPLNIASSWLRLGVGAFDIHRRPAIVERHLAPLGVPPPPDEANRTALVAWWIGGLAAQLSHLLETHPEWTLATHDDLCTDAHSGFRGLYAELGLRWSEATTRFLTDGGYIEPLFRGGDNRFAPGSEPGSAGAIQRAQADAWRSRLTDDEVRQLRSVLDEMPGRGWVRQPAGSG